MKIQLLGTGAADGIPSAYCASRVSDHARKVGKKDIRSRSAALIDDDLKIDFGPDTWHQVVTQDLNPADWSGIVFTHSHDDHLARNELQYALYPFTEDHFAPSTIYGNATVLSKISDRYPDWPFELVETHSFKPFHHVGYKLTPIQAYHKLDEDSQNLLIEHGGKTILYGTDTGIWHEPTWEFLQGWHVDLFVVECTDGKKHSDFFGHVGIEGCLHIVSRLRKMSVLASDTPVVTTHHAHLGGCTHAELEEALAPHGVTVGYDGIVFEV
ncbi:MAG: hypothetical protein JNM85_03605 [Chthonomonas sp.]|nr:hypothetical protein [Chthonomonas sp.]